MKTASEAPTRRSSVDGRSLTRYSSVIRGTHGNFEKPVRFDHSPGGFVGITQFADSTQQHVADRVLLAPNQVKKLLKFIASHGRAE